MKITLVPIPGTDELYAIAIRESASHDPLKLWDEKILKLHDRINELETESAELEAENVHLDKLLKALGGGR